MTDTIGISAALIEMSRELTWRSLPGDVQHAARRHLLDTVGVTIAGMREQVTLNLIDAFVDSNSLGEIRLPVSPIALTPQDTAMLGGTAAHGLELDDGYRKGSSHPGVVVVPALLPVAIGRDTTGIAVLEALLVGYETVTALSEACHPVLRNRGWHPTSTTGVFGAALAAGRLFGLCESRMSHGLGLSGSSAAGLFAFLRGGGDVKRLHAGQAARSGLAAALYASKGIAGPPEILEGKDGFFQAFVAEADGFEIDVEIPPRAAHRIADCYVKPYACCRHLQPAAEALMQLVNDHSTDAGDIEKIEVETYSIAAAHAGTRWQDYASAQLSFPFVMAVAACFRSLDRVWFELEFRNHATVNALAGKVKISASQDMDELYPRLRPARVSVKTKDGNTFTAFAREALGSRLVPLSDEALFKKFLSLTEPVLGTDRSRDLADQLWHLDQVDRAASVFADAG